MLYANLCSSLSFRRRQLSELSLSLSLLPVAVAGAVVVVDTPMTKTVTQARVQVRSVGDRVVVVENNTLVYIQNNNTYTNNTMICVSFAKYLTNIRMN